MAAMQGHTEIADHLLSKPNIDINCKDILFNALINFIHIYILMRFKFIFIYGIDFNHYIGHL